MFFENYKCCNGCIMYIRVGRGWWVEIYVSVHEVCGSIPEDSQ